MKKYYIKIKLNILLKLFNLVIIVFINKKKTQKNHNKKIFEFYI